MSSISVLKASLAEVAGEVPGIKTWFPTLQGTIDASLLPAVMPHGSTGTIPTTGFNAIDRPRVDVVRLWLVVAPLSQDIAEAITATDELLDALAKRLIKAWAGPDPHPLMRYIRRIDEITYSTENTLPIGNTAYVGCEFLITIQEETRVQ